MVQFTDAQWAEKEEERREHARQYQSLYKDFLAQQERIKLLQAEIARRDKAAKRAGRKPSKWYDESTERWYRLHVNEGMSYRDIADWWHELYPDDKPVGYSTVARRVRALTLSSFLSP